ncbi:MAG: AbrB/MazE/SpoVT family DNA-binding domain-containing protein [Ruminococcus sp.]|nr:AbrB/MazE/SpoVT family DNA-binding domain-containing protein [Ruminococcus sp.]
MEAKLQKWGNSNGIRIPNSYLKSLNLKANDMVELTQEKDKIIIAKKKKQHLTLEERIKMFKEVSDEEKGNVEYYDWGEDLGKEKFY